MAVPSVSVQLTGLARKLVMDGLMEEDVAAQAWEESLSEKIPFVRYAVSKNLIDAAVVGGGRVRNAGARHQRYRD